MNHIKINELQMQLEMNQKEVETIQKCYVFLLKENIQKISDENK